MTQDQYGQARECGYVVHGQVAGNETDESADDEGKPMTRFQKVASALRGDRTDRDEPGTDVRDDAGRQAPSDQAGTVPAAPDPYAASPSGTDPNGSYPNGTYPSGAFPDDEAAGPNGTRLDQAVAVSSQAAAGTQDPTPTQPNMYGTGTGTGTAAGPGARADAGDQTDPATTMPDVPAAQMPGDMPVVQALGDVPVTRTPGSAAAPAQDAPGMRPGEAAGTLENLGDLAYADLLPDASVYTEQWQQIQFKFVDDPHASVTEAADVVAQVTARLEAAIQERQRAIEARQQAIQEQQRSLRGRWGEGARADTETLRETLRMYKAFLDQLVGPKV